jgi:hypothetical protein
MRLAIAAWPDFDGLTIILVHAAGALHSRMSENRIATANMAKTSCRLSMNLIIPPTEIKITPSPKIGEKGGTLVLIQCPVLKIP